MKKKTYRRSYREIPFKTTFYKNKKGDFVGRVPSWWSSIHFDIMLVRICFPVKSFIPEEGKQYKVIMTSLGAKRTTIKVIEK